MIYRDYRQYQVDLNCLVMYIYLSSMLTSFFLYKRVFTVSLQDICICRYKYIMFQIMGQFWINLCWSCFPSKKFLELIESNVEFVYTRLTSMCVCVFQRNLEYLTHLQLTKKFARFNKLLTFLKNTCIVFAKYILFFKLISGTMRELFANYVNEPIVTSQLFISGYYYYAFSFNLVQVLICIVRLYITKISKKFKKIRNVLLPFLDVKFLFQINNQCLFFLYRVQFNLKHTNGFLRLNRTFFLQFLVVDSFKMEVHWFIVLQVLYILM
eukprot:TRINITY_DN1094_c0_g1_i2.p2 TRINITY_DN1094_c0_g1~~TRINITY_DN1094_c0_g1_i2.p2  ORF type:complete len:268 (-),score=-17.68 TRINITY_DN1094_c0_g1_i2:289-1092(-)